MNKDVDRSFPRLENDLAGLYRYVGPTQAFADRLEARIRDRAAEIQRPRRRTFLLPGPVAWMQRPAVLITLALIIVLMAAVAAIGPQRVVAAIQDLLGYVPGIGFVDLDEARVLAAPVTVTRAGVTVVVEQVVAEPHKTLVKFSVLGMPAPGSGEITEEDVYYAFDPRLRLPFGGYIRASSMEYDVQGDSMSGRLQFGSITKYDQVWLEFDYLPNVSAGSAPENWRIPIELVPFDGKTSVQEFTQSIQPEGAFNSSNKVKVEILQVAQTNDETAIQVRISWESSEWEVSDVWSPILIDDIGHIYRESGSGASSEATSPDFEGGPERISVLPPLSSLITPGPNPHLDRTYVFPPLSNAAARLTFFIPEIQFSVPVEGSFTVDLGPDPQLGQMWPVDRWVNVAGLDLHVLGARLYEQTLDYGEGETETEYELEFSFKTEPEVSGRVFIVSVDSKAEGIRGSSGAQGGSDEDPLAWIGFSRIPRGEIEVFFTGAEITVQGPWEVSVELPPASTDRTAAEYLSPDARETHNGVTLSVDSIVMSDLATLVSLGLPNLPEGAELQRVDGEVYLENDSQERLQSIQDMGVQEFGYDPARLRFARLPDGSKSLALNVPAVEVFYPAVGARQEDTYPIGQSSLASPLLVVDIPEDVIFHEVKEQIPYREGDEEKYYTHTRWLSDPWPVDLSVEVAGHHLELNQAQLERRDTGFPNIYWLILSGTPPVSPPGEPQLTGLRISKLSRPDGDVVFDYIFGSSVGHDGPYSYIGPEWPDSVEYVSYVRIDVTAADGINLLPGKYVIGVSGVEILVPGPWNLHWSLEEK